MDPLTVGPLAIACLVVLILCGVHVGVALALMSVVGVWGVTGRFDVAVRLLGTTSYRAVMDYVFAVVPLFVMMGLLAGLSGATRDLFSAAQVFLGRTRGGLGITTVIANAIFAAITGVSIASAAVFSRVALPEMARLNYDRRFSLGIVASSALLGMLIPPSVLMIVYGVLTELSIGRLFLGGILPGLLVTVILSFGIWFMVVLKPSRGGVEVAQERPSFGTFVRAAFKPWGVIALVVLVLGGIYGGFFTPTEAGAIGALGALLLVLATGNGNWQNLRQLLLDVAQTTGSIFLLLIAAQMYSRMLTLTGLASSFSGWAAGLPVDPIVIILGFMVVYVLLGMVLDSVSIMLLTVPVMFPVVMQLGFDPIWFGIVMIMAIEIGLLTPPFGMVVFAMKSALGDDVQIEDIYLGVLPFLVMLLAALAITIAYPPIVTWLANAPIG